MNKITYKDFSTIEETLYTKFNGWGQYDLYTSNGAIVVHVEGDWKHAHLYCEHLLNELGYIKVSEDITSEDGSDWYASTHVYEKRV